MIFRQIITSFLVSACAATACLAATSADKFKLVIDAGHGGHDAGAIGTYSKEKNINLNVALAFGKLVEANCSDVKVIYTRKTDVFIPLEERANIANRNKADLFISIHTNALPKGRLAYGSETYTLGMARSSENFDVAKRENSVILVENNYKEKYAGFNPNSAESYIIFEFMQDEHMKQSISLAKSIQKYYVSYAKRKNKGVHQAGFLVLRETSMPSVLTELGFITTPEEEAYLNSTNGINKLARSIFEGFLDYKQTQDGKLRPKVSVPQQQEEEPAPAEAPQESAQEVSPQEDSAPAQHTAKADSATRPNKDGDASVLAQQFGSRDKTEDKPKSSGNKRSNTANNKRSKDQDSAEPTAAAAAESTILFKVQFTTSSTIYKEGDKHLRGFKGVEHYQDSPGGVYKYTCMPTANYSEALANQKEVRKEVPDAFLVAFKDGQRIPLAEALSEYKKIKAGS